MSLFDLGAMLLVKKRHDVTRRQMQLDQFMAAIGDKLAEEITNPNPWRYIGDGNWVDMTVTRQADLVLRA